MDNAIWLQQPTTKETNKHNFIHNIMDSSLQISFDYKEKKKTNDENDMSMYNN